MSLNNVAAMVEGALERQVTEIIDNELLKQNFEETCQRLCMKIIERAQGINEEHKEIKKFFNNIGERVDKLLADDVYATDSRENGIIGKRIEKKKATIIVIDDDDEEDQKTEEEEKQVKSREINNKEKQSPQNDIEKSPKTVSSNTQTKKIDDEINKLACKPIENSDFPNAGKESGGEKEKTNTDKEKEKINTNEENPRSSDEKHTTKSDILEVAVPKQIDKETSVQSSVSPPSTQKTSPLADEKSIDGILGEDVGKQTAEIKAVSVVETDSKTRDEKVDKTKESSQCDPSIKEVPGPNLNRDSILSLYSQEDTKLSPTLQTKTNSLLVTQSDTPVTSLTNTSQSKYIDLKRPKLNTQTKDLNQPISSNQLTVTDEERMSDTREDCLDQLSFDADKSIPNESVPTNVDGDEKVITKEYKKKTAVLPFKSYEKRRVNSLTHVQSTESKEDSQLPNTTYVATKVAEGDDSKLLLKKMDVKGKKYGKQLNIQPLNISTEIEIPPRIKEFSFVKNLIVYAKPVKSDIWYQAKLLQEVPKKRGKISFLVQFISGQKLQQRIEKKCMASTHHCHIDDVELGTRIVAGRPSDTVNSTIQKKYKDISSNTSFTVMFAGTISELACSGNRYRYLVFFDDGYAQYLPLNRIFPVVSSSDAVWDDVSSDCQEFIKEYLQQYPIRPLVVTKIGCTMQTEWNGKWWHSKVVSVDSSLVKILFDVDKRSEWIYRGTTRLEPMYNHFVNPPEKPTKEKRRRKTVTRSNKEDSYVDDTITDPQYGICKYSLTDPQGKRQIMKWSKTMVEQEKIIMKCQEDGSQLKSPRLNSPSTITEKSLEGRKKKRSSLLIPQSSCNENSKSPSTSPKQKKKMKIKHEDDSTVDTTDEMSNVSPPVISPADIKEEISQEDLLGALSALATSPSEKSSDLCSPRPEKSSPGDGTIKPADESEKPHSTKTVSPKRPVKHSCGEHCITDRRDMLQQHKSGNTNYLSIPFSLGWKRESAKKSFSYRRDIYYRTPCNKRMRNLTDVTKYLLETKCDNVCIDMFCFHSKISCRSHPSRPKNPKVKKDDLSDGRETCPVALINDVSDEIPPHLAYISSRNKAEDVFINIDPGFLVCCDCTDFCQDKTKCQCAQLTIEQSNAIDGVIDKNAGYQYRRLKECITTGIYECNPNCSCSKSCHNRLVQNGIQLRLQVFMTENRGWGLQCIDDIPKGTFICTYAGQILNEHTANREGMDYGDEYLAELDHIEVIEKAKEGYESDVPELRDRFDGENDSDSFTESESSESVINISSDTSDSSLSDGGVMDQPISKRLKILKEIQKGTGVPDESPDTAKEKQASTYTNTECSSETTSSHKDACKANNCQVTLKRIPSTNILQQEKYGIEVESQIKPKNFSKNFGHVPLAKKSTCQVPFKKRQADTSTPLSLSNTKKTEEENKKMNKEKVVSTRSLFNNDEQMYVIDAKSFGNVGRFMNHSCSPNLFVQNVMIDTHDLRFPWVAFFAQQNIPAYTELTWDYSYEIGSVPGKTLLCKCGASNCKGRLL